MLGASLGSARLQFAPGEVAAGSYRFDIGSAGSASLVMQTVLLPLLLAPGHSEVTLIGGTHNPLAPSYDFLVASYLPQLRRLGFSADVQLVQRGFYPAGGGQLRATIAPTGELTDFSLMQRGALLDHRARVIVSKLPISVAEHEASTLREKLRWKKEAISVEEDRTSVGPGNVVLIELRYENVIEVVASFGARGKRAEAVATEAADEATQYLAQTAPVGPHLADQLLLPLGIAASRGHRGRFRTMPLTQHSRTHIDILQRFLDIQVAVSEEGDSAIVEVAPSARE